MVTNGKPNAVSHKPPGPRLAGLALGLRGRGEAELVGHIAICVTCAAHLEDLVAVAGTLSLLAPEADPPSGFEGRVLEAARAGSARCREGTLRAWPGAACCSGRALFSSLARRSGDFPWLEVQEHGRPEVNVPQRASEPGQAWGGRSRASSMARPGA